MTLADVTRLTSREFNDLLRGASREQAEHIGGLLEWPIDTWPLSLKLKDYLLRTHAQLRWQEELEKCRTLEETYAVQRRMDAELMPVLQEINPLVYGPMDQPKKRRSCGANFRTSPT